jgi:hypothetical protein
MIERLSDFKKKKLIASTIGIKAKDNKEHICIYKRRCKTYTVSYNITAKHILQKLQDSVVQNHSMKNS